MKQEEEKIQLSFTLCCSWIDKNSNVGHIFTIFTVTHFVSPYYINIFVIYISSHTVQIVNDISGHAINIVNSIVTKFEVQD